MMISAAHIHHAQLRDAIYTGDQRLTIPFFISPAICPVYMNNPGYAKMEVHKSSDGAITMENLKIHWFQLQYYVMFGIPDIWEEQDPLLDHGMDLNNPRGSFTEFFDTIKTADDYGSYYGYEYGLDPFTREYLLGKIMMPLYIEYQDQQMIAHNICIMMYYMEESYEFQQCLN